MGPQILEEILIPLSFFALVFGIFYIRTRENMALIERGINPRVTETRPKHFINLKWGLLLSGAGLGLLIAYFIDINTRMISHMDSGKNPAVYFSLIAIGGGLGLISSYFIERKYWANLDKKNNTES